MTTKEKLKNLLDYTDKNNKKLSYNPEEGGKIYLDIDGETRCLGHILIGDTKILYTKFDDERNIFRKTNSWSINENILKHVDSIHIETRTCDYSIPKDRAVEFGTYFHFQDTTELKVYIPLIYWDIRKKGMESVFPKEFKFRNTVGDSWYPVLKDNLESEMMSGISKYLKTRRLEATVYPDSNDVFKAFKLCSFEHTKVVILGQDPYTDGTANGLAFGYKEGTTKAYSKSLDVIHKEVENNCYDGMKLEFDHTLKDWAKQGVLLLNTVLTVEKGKPLSHAKTKTSAGIGWERFTKIVTWKLIYDTNPKVFLVWGARAKEHITEVLAKCSPDKVNQHCILYANHPASDLYKKGNYGDYSIDYPNTFLGCLHFASANKFLSTHKRKEIRW